MRYSTCLNTNRIQKGNATVTPKAKLNNCGERALWKRGEEGMPIEINIKDESLCVWRLFDEPETESERVKYWVNFKGGLNVEVLLFDYDPTAQVSVILTNEETPYLDFAKI